MLMTCPRGRGGINSAPTRHFYAWEDPTSLWSIESIRSKSLKTPHPEIPPFNSKNQNLTLHPLWIALHRDQSARAMETRFQARLKSTDRGPGRSGEGRCGAESQVRKGVHGRVAWNQAGCRLASGGGMRDRGIGIEGAHQSTRHDHRRKDPPRIKARTKGQDQNQNQARNWIWHIT